MPIVEFDIPFPSRVHPDTHQLHDDHMAWMRRMGLMQSAEATHNHAMQGVEDVAALVYSQVPYAGLLLATDMSWITVLLDDYCDSERANLEGVRKFIEPFILLTHYPDDTQVDENNPLIRAWRDVWSRTTQGMSREWQERVLQHWGDFFNGWMDESIAHVTGESPRLDNFYEARRKNFGARVYIDLAESACHIELSSRVVHHPHFQKMIEICVDVLIHVNDVFSLERELARGECNNLVMTIQEERNCTKDEAIAEVTQMTAELCQQFVALEADIPKVSTSLSLTEFEQQHISQYVDILRSFMRGNYDWSQIVGRYKGENAHIENPPYLADIRG